jgi:hypothetical protein
LVVRAGRGGLRHELGEVAGKLLAALLARSADDEDTRPGSTVCETSLLLLGDREAFGVFDNDMSIGSTIAKAIRKAKELTTILVVQTQSTQYTGKLTC